MDIAHRGKGCWSRRWFCAKADDRAATPRKIYVNDRLLENLPKIYQAMIPKIVAHDAKLVRDDRQALEDWLVTQKGQPQTFTVEGPLFELEGGDEYVIPFFFFSMGDQNLLKPGWDQWLAANSKKQYDQASNQEFLVQSLMAARQRDEQIQQQIAQMQLNQAVLTGTTSLWEVTLYPGRGIGGLAAMGCDAGDQ